MRPGPRSRPCEIIQLKAAKHKSRCARTNAPAKSPYSRGQRAGSLSLSGFEDIAGIYVASPQPNGDIWYSLASDPDRTARPTIGLSAPFGYDFCHPTACACTAYGAGDRCGYKFLLTPGSIFRWGNTAAEIEECYDVARSIASLGSDGAKARSVASWLLVACFGLVF